MASHAATHDSHEHHVQPVWYYVRTAILLTILMGATIVFAFVDFHNVVVNNLIALAIACIKSALVVWYFMHVKFASVLGKLFAFLGFVWLGALATVLVDYGFRSHEPTPSWQLNGKESALPRQLRSTDGAPNSANGVNIQNRIAPNKL